MYPLDSPEAAGESSAESHIEQTLAPSRSAEELQERLEWQDQLELARARWRDSNPTSYTVKVRKACFCAPLVEDNVEVVVEQGDVVEAWGVSAEGKYDVPISKSSLRDWYSVQGMFELIEQSLTADRVVVEYDEQDGFPAYVLLDYQLISSEEGDIFEMWDFARTTTN